MTHIQVWQMQQSSTPMQKVHLPLKNLAPDEVLVQVAACGVCHTDLGFFYEGIRTVKPPPLVLGHEISGFVSACGEQARHWQGQAVIVPAVLPCGECDLCRKGRATICRNQKMPGNHIHGGFADHVVVPARYLCPVGLQSADSQFGESGVSLQELAVLADAVTTPYQAVKNAGLGANDLAIFIGAGGIGGFGVQIAHALGAKTVAIDISEARLQLIADHGADLILSSGEHSAKELRKRIQEFAAHNSLSAYEWKIFETSGSKAGQELAFALLTFGATLSVVGFTKETLELRLSNLMAYDARAIGNWGCHPAYYPEVLEMIKFGKIKLAPFVETFPMSQINAVFERLHARQLQRRPILIPDF